MGTCQTAQKTVQIIMEMPVKRAALLCFSNCGFDKSKTFQPAYLVHYAHKIPELIIAYEAMLSK